MLIIKEIRGKEWRNETQGGKSAEFSPSTRGRDALRDRKEPVVDNISSSDPSQGAKTVQSWVNLCSEHVSLP